MAGTHDIARDSGMKDTELKTALNAILSRCKNGERVLLKDFGTFEMKHVLERTIKSPQIPNGEALVPAHNVIKFRPAPASKLFLNTEGATLEIQVEEPKPAPAPKAKPVAPPVAAAPKPVTNGVAKPAPAKAAPAAVAAKPAAVAAKPATPAVPRPAAAAPVKPVAPAAKAAPVAAKPVAPAKPKPAPAPAPEPEPEVVEDGETVYEDADQATE